MSHMKIKRKRTHSPKLKLYSEQSRNQNQKYSIQKIIHENINRRRFSTHNSPNRTLKSQESHLMQMKSQLQQAKKLFKEKNTKKALSLFKQLYKKYPKSSQIPYYIGSCLLNEGKYDVSINYFKISLATDPNYDKNIYLYLAVNFKALGQYVSACNILNEGIQKFPRFEEAFFYRAKMQMKMGKIQQANQDLKKCIIMNNNNELAYIFMGDNYRHSNKTRQALEKYEKAISLNGSHQKMASIKKLDLLIDLQRYEEGEIVLEQMKKKSLDSPIINLYEGLLLYESKKLTESVIAIETALTHTLNKNQLLKAFKTLLNICIEKKDFFEAEHLIHRAKSTKNQFPQLYFFYYFVEGVNDIIKRKLSEASQKLIKAKDVCPKSHKQEYMKIILPYEAYCLFLLGKLGESLDSYNSYLKLDCHSQAEQYNRNICEGVILNKQKEYNKAQIKFSKAYILCSKIEPLFFNCINAIQKLKQSDNIALLKESTLEYLSKQFEESKKLKTLNSLFLFYESLVLLYQGKDAINLISKAIKTADEDISQYYYIKGLCYSLSNQPLSGLQCINKAIQLDGNIGQFYKQRSKYYYILERYDDACEQLERVLEDGDDDECKLLITFYYYMNDQYKQSYAMLNSINETNKFSQFQEALHFRIGNYEGCGMIGKILKGIIYKNCQLSQETLKQINSIILKREIISEFTTYHYHLFIAIYYCYNERFEESLEHLFGALEQIQYFIDEKEQYNNVTETMLNQVKFNIIIVSILKEKDQEKPQTLKYIEVFIAETENQEFLSMMQFITEIIEKGKIISEITQIYEDLIKVSDHFPQITVIIGKSSFKTKLIALYPQKLKFNIAPQFDDSFLYNFDIEKIDNKLSPPWFKVQNQQILFTDKIRNQSILLSETEKPSTPLLIPSPVPVNLKEKFKLDDMVEKKLKNLMKKK